MKVTDQDSRSSMEDTKILEVAWNKEEVRIGATSSPSKSKRSIRNYVTNVVTCKVLQHLRYEINVR